MIIQQTVNVHLTSGRWFEIGVSRAETSDYVGSYRTDTIELSDVSSTSTPESVGCEGNLAASKLWRRKYGEVRLALRTMLKHFGTFQKLEYHLNEHDDLEEVKTVSVDTTYYGEKSNDILISLFGSEAASDIVKAAETLKGENENEPDYAKLCSFAARHDTLSLFDPEDIPELVWFALDQSDQHVHIVQTCREYAASCYIQYEEA